MFNRKECNKCGKKIKEDYDFCPYCGNKSDDNNNWGIIGKNDFFQEATNPLANSLFGTGAIDQMFNGVVKMLEKELRNTNPNQNLNANNQNMPIRPKTHLQLFINGKKINLNGMKINNPENPAVRKQSKKPVKQVPSTYLSKENSQKFSKLPRQEPKTNVRRLSDKIVYEIEMPDIKSLKDISIVKLESSIEIKAIGKDKSYSKTIRIGLPIVDYYLEEGKLVLELGNDPAQI